MMELHHMMEFYNMRELHNIMEFRHIMEFHNMMEFHYMMEFHHMMDNHNFIWFVKSLAVLTTYWYKMSLVKPLFVASIASLTLMMTSVSATIDLLQQMGILPTVGTCSNCSSPTGGYKSDGLYNCFRCSNCKKKQSLLQNSVLSNSNTTLHDFVLQMYQFCNSHRTYNTLCAMVLWEVTKGNFSKLSTSGLGLHFVPFTF